MSERDRNEDREQRRRDRDDRGFFERAREWLGDDRGEGNDRPGNPGDNRFEEDFNRADNYDTRRRYRGEDENPSYHRARTYDTGVQNYGRDYSRDDQDPRDYRDRPTNRDPQGFRDRYEGYRGQERYGGQYGGQGFRSGEQGYRGEFRDSRQDDDYARESRDFRRGGYNEGLSRGRYGNPANRNQSDWDFDEQMRRTYGSEESGRNFSRRSGRPYPTAGMRSDFGSDYNYENEYGEDRWAGRGRSGTFDYNSRNQGSGRFSQGGGGRFQGGRDRDMNESDYLGYEREGAFYQDLDEPYSFEYWEIWMVPGEFTGMGPSNYQRTDERIQEDVCERLTRHGRIDASQVEIEVKEGEVFLRGQVPSRDMKRMSEDTAEGVTGVKNVHNEIRVPRRQQGEQQWQRGRETYGQGETNRDYNRDNQDWNRGRQGGQMDTSRYEANREGFSGSTTETGGSSQIDTTSRVTGQQTGGEHTTGQQMRGQQTTSGQSRPGQQSAGTTSTTSGAGQVSPESEKRSGLRQGMEVIGKNGKVVGRVKEIRASDFLVDREMARDIFVPMDAVESVGAQVMLKIAEDEVDNQDWEKPDILG